LGPHDLRFPRVASRIAGQPWAGGRNPIGIEDTRRARFARIAVQYLAAASLLVLTACSTTKPANPNPSPNKQMAKHLTFSKMQRLEANYLLFLPETYGADKEKRWPLILFLHGAGERGTDVWKVAVHGPPKNVTSHSDFPFILVSPQCPSDQAWSKDTLLALLDEITLKYAVDTNRVYLTGLSMGGYGTWDLGICHPEKFAAIAPICGGGDLISVLLASREKMPALKALGIWAFHGAKDPVVPVEESKRMVEAVKRVGATDVKLTIYPEAQHDAWTETYKNPELYEWFLAHKRD
jgi:predicted peptidase